MNGVLLRSPKRRSEEYPDGEINHDPYWKERKATLIDSAKQEDPKRQKCQKVHANSGHHTSAAVLPILCRWTVKRTD